MIYFRSSRYDFCAKTKNLFIPKLNLKIIKKKIEHSINLKTHTFADTVYVLGNFENPDYFSMYRKELIRKFQINRKYLNLNNPIINQLQNHNSISIHLRRDRFSDQSTISNSHLSKKSDD